MKKKQAYRIAIQAMQAEIKKYAFDANLYRMGIAQYPHAVNAARKYVDLLQAIQFLKADGKQSSFLEQLEFGADQDGNI